MYKLFLLTTLLSLQILSNSASLPYECSIEKVCNTQGYLVHICYYETTSTVKFNVLSNSSQLYTESFKGIRDPSLFNSGCPIIRGDKIPSLVYNNEFKYELKTIQLKEHENTLMKIAADSLLAKQTFYESFKELSMERRSILGF